MTEAQKQRLEAQLWKIANELRGKMNADEFRDYILGFIFYKYLSEKQHLFANKLLETEEIKDYRQVISEEDLAAIREESLEKLGYFLRPQELFSAITKKGNIKIDDDDEDSDGNFILEDLQAILNAIEQSTMGNDSEDEFNKLFEDIDLSSTKLGRTPSARNKLIAKVLVHLDGIDFQLDKVDADVLGDAYEYLIGQFASGAGKKAGEFYTPQQVSRVLAKIVTLGKTRIKNAYDPACGSGSLLLRIAKEAEVGEFAGQELNRTTYNLARMNMILHDVHYSRFDIRQEDTLEEPQHIMERFEAVVANPPFSAQWKGADNPLNETDDRFSQYGRLAPSRRADFAFVQHMIYQLAENGTAAVVLPHGVLFRGDAEGVIRRYMIEQMNYLDAVIGLPPNLFYGTSIPACILILKKCRANDGDILFIDASSDFDKRGNQNALSDVHVEKIVETYRSRKAIAKYSHVAPISEVVENDYNLNISRYIDKHGPEEIFDIEGIASLMNSSAEAMAEAEEEIRNGCEALGIAEPKGYNQKLLNQFKLGCMQRLFSKSMRFKDVDGKDFPDWQESTIGEVGHFYYGKSAPKFSLSPDAPTPCVRYGELYSKYGIVIETVESRTNIDPKQLKFSSGGEILVPRVGEDPLDFAACCCYLPHAGIAIGEMISVFNTNQNPLFYTYYFRTLRKQFARVVEGGNVSNLYYSYLEPIKVGKPHPDEQARIVRFLTAIDTKIRLVSKQLEGETATALDTIEVEDT